MENKTIMKTYYNQLKPNEKYIETGDPSCSLISERIWCHTNRHHRKNKKNGMIGIYQSNEKGNKKGSPIGYTNVVILEGNIMFTVSQKGVENILKTRKRQLVAGVSGICQQSKLTNIKNFFKCDFNPDIGHFYLLEDKRENKDIVVSCEKVFFSSSTKGEYNLLVENPILFSKQLEKLYAITHNK